VSLRELGEQFLGDPPDDLSILRVDPRTLNEALQGEQLDHDVNLHLRQDQVDILVDLLVSTALVALEDVDDRVEHLLHSLSQFISAQRLVDRQSLSEEAQDSHVLPSTHSGSNQLLRLLIRIRSLLGTGGVGLLVSLGDCLLQLKAEKVEVLEEAEELYSQGHLATVHFLEARVEELEKSIGTG